MASPVATTACVERNTKLPDWGWQALTRSAATRRQAKSGMRRLFRDGEIRISKSYCGSTIVRLMKEAALLQVQAITVFPSRVKVPL